ncbi:hypothetical protein SCLCIDRAFT_130887, partial [Scleroderma citrinum Foug A]
IEYEAFEFVRQDCIVDGDGNISLVKHNETETVLVAKHWQKHISGGVQHGDYIAKGLSKFVFKGSFHQADYAIFQCKPISSCESSNVEDLIQELHLLHLADYFLASFYQQAKVHCVNLPRIAWNVKGAFIGTVTAQILLKSMDNDDDCTLLFKTFLAAPFLSCDGLYVERKFCGNTDIPQNEDRLGLAIDAYIHHTLLNSGKTVLLSDLQGVISPDASVTLFDPQAHTYIVMLEPFQHDQTSGHWDEGEKQIRTYLKAHQCNNICRMLKLHLDTDSEEDDSTGGRDYTIPGSARNHPLCLGF